MSQSLLKYYYNISIILVFTVVYYLFCRACPASSQSLLLQYYFISIILLLIIYSVSVDGACHASSLRASFEILTLRSFPIIVQMCQGLAWSVWKASCCLATSCPCSVWTWWVPSVMCFSSASGTPRWVSQWGDPTLVVVLVPLVTLQKMNTLVLSVVFFYP